MMPYILLDTVEKMNMILGLLSALHPIICSSNPCPATQIELQVWLLNLLLFWF